MLTLVQGLLGIPCGEKMTHLAVKLSLKVIGGSSQCIYS
jgi:hypothetical protein